MCEDWGWCTYLLFLTFILNEKLQFISVTYLGFRVPVWARSSPQPQDPHRDLNVFPRDPIWGCDPWVANGSSMGSKVAAGHMIGVKKIQGRTRANNSRYFRRLISRIAFVYHSNVNENVNDCSLFTETRPERRRRGDPGRVPRRLPARRGDQEVHGRLRLVLLTLALGRWRPRTVIWKPARGSGSGGTGGPGGPGGPGAGWSGGKHVHIRSARQRVCPSLKSRIMVDESFSRI